MTNLIEDMQHRINTLEYLLAQTLTIALRNSDDPDGLINDMQIRYAEKMASIGITADSGNKGFDAAERIITSVKASI
jgi:hypothetical protein